MKKIKKLKKFYKEKNNFYKKATVLFKDYLENNSLTNETIQIDLELKNEKFDKVNVTKEIIQYTEHILNILEILTSNLELNITLVKYNEKSKEDFLKRVSICMETIFKLSHMKIFNSQLEINRLEILSNLVEAMSLSIQKDTMFVDLTTKRLI